MAILNDISPLIQPERKLGGLHGIRAIAAMAVVLFHVRAILTLDLDPAAALLVDHLYLSVQLFFVVSAFSLFHSHTLSPTTIKAYLLKRFFRIAPLFYLLVGFQIWRNLPYLPDWRTIGVNVTFLFNVFPRYQSSFVWAGWSVGVEMLFYILLPIVFSVALRIRRQRLFFASLYVGCVLVSTSIWFFFRGAMGDEFCYTSVFSNLAPFAAGLFAYRLYLSWLTHPVGSRQVSLTLGFVLLLILVAFDPLGLHWRAPGLYFATWGIPFGVLCIWQSLYPSTILLTPSVQWLADRSFSLYLLHPVVIEYSKPLFAELEPIGLAGGWLYAVSTALTLAILLPLANLTFKYIEIPGINLGRTLLLGRSAIPAS